MDVAGTVVVKDLFIVQLAALLFVLLVWCVFVFSLHMIVSIYAKHGPLLAEKPKELLSFKTSRTCGEVARAVAEYAIRSRLEIPHLDEEGGVVIIGLPACMEHYGFFLPVYLSELEEQVLVEVGIRPRAGVPRGLKARVHQRVFNAIRAVVEFDL